MRPERIPVLNIEIDNFTKEELLKNLKEGILITPNVDHLVKLQHDREFYEIYKKADYITLDSQIVRAALKYLGKPARDLIAGSDLFPAFCQFHKNNPEINVFLLGAAEGVATTAMKKINDKIGREIVVGAHSPTFGFEKSEAECKKIIDIVNNSGANVLAVGVGAPKQEKWIFKYHKEMPSIKIFMAIGATIDFEAGNVKRAPKIFQKLALEWLFRLISNPKRLWRRYLIDDLSFFYFILKQKIGQYRNPFLNE